MPHAPLRTSAILAAVLTGLAAPAAAVEEVNLYSYRQPSLMQPLLDAFTKETGIKVNVVYSESGLLERLKSEGANSPADVVLTADVGNLNDLVEAGLLQPVKSARLEANIPSQYRDPQGRWFGLSMRARIILASKERIKPGTVTRYEDLAKPELRGKLCTRSGKHVYMVSLVASRIAHDGEAATAKWLTAVKNNLARKPQGNDRSQAKAIAQGECDIALINTYYYGLMQTNKAEPAQQKWAAATYIVFPDQNGRGTHVNVSGGGVTAASKHKANAVRLLEFLSGDAAQALYAEKNYEYPVKPGAKISSVVAAWGTFKADTLNLGKVAESRAAASRLVDRIGYDAGPGS